VTAACAQEQQQLVCQIARKQVADSVALTLPGCPTAPLSQANKRWKGLEVRLTDATNEAKDNVRYLATLDQPFEVSMPKGCCNLQQHLQACVSNVMLSVLCF